MAATTPTRGKTQNQDHPAASERGPGDAKQSRGDSGNSEHPASGVSYSARTAADIVSLVERLTDFTKDELRQIRIVDKGAKLKQGAAYLDLRSPTSVPFTATDDIVAQEINLYAAKSDVPYEYWNRLVELLGPGRIIDRAPQDAAQNQPFTPERAAEESAVERIHREKTAGSPAKDTKVDEASAESFPASDPPSWNTGRDRSQKTEKNK